MSLLTLFLVSFFSISQPSPPDSISLKYCYQKARENYPTTKKIELQRKITALNVDVANSGYFPQINVSGKATYQSEVTEFSTPGAGGPPPLSKDQYEASVDAVQTIFNDGAVGIRKDLEQAKGQRQMASVRVDIHKIRSQVNQVYFGILLSFQQQKTIHLLTNNLSKQLSTIRSKVENGVLLPSQQHILKARLIKARQDSAETRSNIRAGYKVLSELTGLVLTTKNELELPDVQQNYQSLQPKRAEYDLFESNRKTLEQQLKLAGTQKWPRLSAFGTAAYGRPGLNFLNNDFHDYYIVGLRVKWDFWDAFNAGRKTRALEIEQQKIDQDQQAFTRQLNASLDRISEQIASIREKMDRDDKIIKLRQQIVDESSSQLENGVITATEYVSQLTQANRAQLSRYIHRVQLAQAQINYVTTLGISRIN